MGTGIHKDEQWIQVKPRMQNWETLLKSKLRMDLTGHYIKNHDECD